MKITTHGFAACSFLTIVSCNDPHSEQSLIWTAEKNVSARLKDEASAKFSGEYVIMSLPSANGNKALEESTSKLEQSIKALNGQAFTVCGYVNGKNSFGAMAGNTRFVATGMYTKDTLDIMNVAMDEGDVQSFPDKNGNMATSFEATYWNTGCVDSTHPPIYSGKL